MTALASQFFLSLLADCSNQKAVPSLRAFFKINGTCFYLFHDIEQEVSSCNM